VIDGLRQSEFEEKRVAAFSAAFFFLADLAGH